MNKLLTLTSAAVLSTAVAQANAAIYQVDGFFDAGTANFQASIGGPNVLTGGSATISGYMTTDSDAPGYTITGGNIVLNSTTFLAPTGPELQIDMINLSGTPTNAGVLMTSGSVCVSPVAEPGSCSLGLVDVATNNIPFLPGITWGYNTTSGLQLNGAGGASFTVAQPGNLAETGGPAGGAAVAGFVLLGNAAGIFMSGDLTMTEVPVPAAAWMFGSGLIGLAGVARRRRRQS